MGNMYADPATSLLMLLFLANYPCFADTAGVKQVSFLTDSSNFTKLDEIGALIDGGKVNAVVQHAYRLDQLPAAFNFSKKGGVVGKLAICVLPDCGDVQGNTAPAAAASSAPPPPIGHKTVVSATKKVCKASDPALNLTRYADGGGTYYYASNDEELQRMCECTAMDYVKIGAGCEGGGADGCETCTQESLDACKLESITGKDAYDGVSLDIEGAPLITSLRGLARLSGALPGALLVDGMDKLTTLDGLDGITSIGKDHNGNSITLIDSPNLTSATALSNAGTFTADTLIFGLVPNELACVPEHWPAKESTGRTIRNGKALHDPCLYQCDSAMGTCYQTATGLANESACARVCLPPAPSQFYKCVHDQCVSSPSGLNKSTCEATCG
jgi:hypothetical protein